MATKTANGNDSLLGLAVREWNEFAYVAFARIVARKHNIPVPEVDLANLSDEELERRLRLVSELAHLPPA